MKIAGVEYSWTQPICDTCFAGIFPNNDNPVRIKDEVAETCCLCGTGTRSGLYVRLNPSTVLHPTPKE